MAKRLRSRSVSTWILGGCGIWLIALGLYFIAVRPPLLPEDQRLMGATLAQIRVGVPGLEAWLAKVFTVMGGFMMGTGVLTAFIAATAMRDGLVGTTRVLALTGVLTVGLMSGINFALDSDFKWLLLVPAVLWAVGLCVEVVGRRSP